MRILFIVFLFVSFSKAQTINQLIHYSTKKHQSLQSIKHRLSAMDERIQKSQKWANPDLSLGINDIQFRKPLSRDEERMQNQAINFKQKFPWFDKLDARKNVALEEKHVIFHSLEAAQVALAYNIRTTAYNIKELQLRIRIIHKYMQLARQNIKLYTDYISVDTMSHADSVSAELSLSKLEIRAERYTSLLNAQKEKLHYLVQKKVKNISDKLTMIKPKSLKYYLAGIRKNPNYHRKLAQSDVARANKSLIDLEKYPDPYVQVGYFNRTDYPDYTSVSVGISLPIYGTEELNSEIAQKESLARQSESIDYKFLIKSQIRQAYVKLTEAYKIYNIIQKQSLPQLDHMLELSSSAIEEGADLFTYTNILEQKLALEEERIAIIAEYMRTQAKLKSLTGVK
ncbi:MAG: TolC family protein [Sulfurovum sp.]|nr:TolC family protein [Sulfurovum sp.]